jgi:hypothetical protein
MAPRVINLITDKDYRADPTGVADARAKWQAAHDAIVAAGGGTLIWYGKLKMLSGVTWNPTKVSLFGLGGELDFSTMTSGDGILCQVPVAGSGGTQYGHTQHQGTSFRIRGGGRATTFVGLAYDTDVAGFSSRSLLQSVYFETCGIGIEMRDRAYLGMHSHLGFNQCGKCVSWLGGADAGENISFTQSTFANSDIAIYVGNVNNGPRLNFSQCSLDYTPVWIDLRGGNGYVHCFACHFEMGGHQLTSSSQTVINNFGGYIALGDCNFLITGAHTVTPDHFFDLGNSGSNRLHIYGGTKMYNMESATGYLAKGSGQIFIDGGIKDKKFSGFPSALERHSLLGHGGMFNGSEWTAAGGQLLDTAVYSASGSHRQTLTGVGSWIVDANDAPRSTSAFRMRKDAGAGTAFTVSLFAPFQPGFRASWRAWLKWINGTLGAAGTTATITVDLDFVQIVGRDANGVPQVGMVHTPRRKTLTIALDSNAAWAETIVHGTSEESVVSGDGYAPHWVNAVRIKFVLDNAPVGRLVMDEVRVAMS